MITVYIKLFDTVHSLVWKYWVRFSERKRNV